MPAEEHVQGVEMRRRVLGEEYVARASERATAFSADLQLFLNEHCWGAVWNRPGLDLRTRSVVTLSVLAVTGRWSEFATHIAGAFRNGLSEGELREILLHIGTYAGVPVAVEAFRVADASVADAKSVT